MSTREFRSVNKVFIHVCQQIGAVLESNGAEITVHNVVREMGNGVFMQLFYRFEDICTMKAFGWLQSMLLKNVFAHFTFGGKHPATAITANATWICVQYLIIVFWVFVFQRK